MEVVVAPAPSSLHLAAPSPRRLRTRSSSGPRRVAGIEDLPFEVLEMVARYLKLGDLRNAVRVSKFWLACLSPFVFMSLHISTIRGDSDALSMSHRPVRFVPRLHEHNHPRISPRGGWYTSLVKNLSIDVRDFCCETCLGVESTGMFEFIRLCPNLQGIRLVHTGVIGTPDLFAPYLPPTLRRISITRWRLEHLSLPSTIEELQLHQCFVIDMLSQLQRMPALRALEMVRCWPRWSKESIRAMLEQCGAGLERLVLKDDYGERWIGAIEDAVMADVAELCPNLTQLSLASVLISDVGVASLAAGCPRLDRLELEAGSGEGRPSVSDVSLVTIFTTWPRLRALKLVYVDITSDALSIIAQAAHHLETLDIHLLGGLKLHDFAVLKTLPRLKKVTFKSFFLPGDYSDEARNRMAREMPFELVLEV